MASTLDAPETLATLPGLMMDIPLTLHAILEHATRNHPRREIVSRDGDAIVRETYEAFGKRVAQLAHALARLGVRPGDRVASFGWNTHRHLELYYAVPCMGAVLHTTNIRLFPEQVAYVIGHAEDKVVFVDASLVPAMRAAIAVDPALGEKTFVVMGSGATESLPNQHDYEALLAPEETAYAWPSFDEKSAAILCYTSATTGDPKGVLFSHRSTMIHAFATAFTDVFAIRESDAVLPIVPQFHVNAWGLPFISLMAGAKVVMPGAKLDPQSVSELCEAEGVTFSAGVPTVWLAARDFWRARGKACPTLQRIVIGGSSVPPALLDDLEALGIRVIHAWGMTEMSPIGTVSYVKAEVAAEGTDAVRRAKLKQGPFSPIVQWRVLDPDGREVPQDGVARGELYVRGHAVAKAYYANDTANENFAGGWFRTGDIVTVDRHGYMEIVDRAKDLIKSGGEWISSVDLENTMMGHPAVKEACVFGVPHEKWIERPVAAVVLRDGNATTEAELRDWLSERVAKWMLPDRVLFVDAIPRTGVGKFLKRELRERYRDVLTA